jgi:hypothetical protein
LKMWCHLRAWLVRRADFAKTLAMVRKIQFWGEGCHLIELDDRWLGTYPWGEEFSDLQTFCVTSDRWVRDETMPIEQSIVQWGGDNHAGLLPVPRVLQMLNARWSGYDFDFVNAAGERVAFSPSEADGSCGPLFVQKPALISALQSGDWTLIWAVVGDRSCFDHDALVHVSDAEMQFSAVYWLEGEYLVGGLTRTDIFPIPRQN